MEELNVNQAFLVVTGLKPIPIIGFHVNFSQTSDPILGKGMGVVTGGSLHIDIANLRVSSLIDWTVNPNELKSGSIQFMRGDALATEVKFTDGTLADLFIGWEQNSIVSKNIIISAVKLDIMGTPYDRNAA